MGNWNNKVRLTNSERAGIIVLLLLIIVLVVFKGPVASLFVKNKKPGTNTSYAALIQQIESAKPDYTDYADKKSGSYNSNNKQFLAAGSYTASNYEKQSLVLEINSASAAEFEKLYGIGKVLAARIVKFRDGLGGFQRIDQVNDVYGIEDSVYQNIRTHLKIKPAAIRQINVNEADLETLSKNPYIAPTLAKQFIGYRTKVKPFDNVEEIKKLYYLKDHPELFEKLSPYITVN